MKISVILTTGLSCLSLLTVNAFAAEKRIPGDVSGDGTVTADDARMTLRAAVGLLVFDEAEKKAGDTDGDGGITSGDARLILRASVGLETLCERTDRGFVIEEKDGVTYVDGVLIVNKTYSLPGTYNPGGLTKECAAAFEEMKAAAEKKGLNLYISSGFRSYAVQKSIYSRYCSRDGSAYADRYSARPGHSEHQTGLAIDLNTITQSFKNTKEGKWVAENCYKYGFILRYPRGKEDKTGFMYEPWHIRYVGKENAKKIYDSGLCLEEYYGISSEYNK